VSPTNEQMVKDFVEWEVNNPLEKPIFILKGGQP
jgi:hypothetical protein